MIRSSFSSESSIHCSKNPQEQKAESEAIKKRLDKENNDQAIKISELQQELDDFKNTNKKADPKPPEQASKIVGWVDSVDFREAATVRNVFWKGDFWQ